MASARRTQSNPIELIYIHGRRDSDRERKWLDSLDRAVVRTGDGSLSQLGFNVCAPEWLKTLNGGDGSFFPRPKRTSRPGVDYEACRSAYQHSSNSLRRHLEEQGLASLPPGFYERISPKLRDRAADLAMRLRMRDVRKYLSEESLRYRCLDQVLRELPTEGEAVIIAHSLGSVLLADLIYLLPPTLRIRMLVTSGSPLALPPLHEHTKSITKQFPFDRVGPWLNLAGRGDPIGGAGISGTFPEVIDVNVDTRWDGESSNPHSPRTYLGQEHVAAALVWVAGQEGARRDSAPKVSSRKPDDLTPLFAGFQYALRFEQALPLGDRREEFAEARRLNARVAAARLARQPGASGVLAEDLLRDNQELLAGFDTTEQLRLLVLLAASNPLDLPDISESGSATPIALASVSVDLGGLPKWGSKVHQGLREARATHSRDSALKRRMKVQAGLVAIERGPIRLWGWGVRQVMEGMATDAIDPLFSNLLAASPEALIPLSSEALDGRNLGGERLSCKSAGEVAQTVLLLHAFALVCLKLDHPPGLRRALDSLIAIRAGLEAALEAEEPTEQEDLTRKLESVLRALSDPDLKKAHGAHQGAEHSPKAGPGENP